MVENRNGARGVKGWSGATRRIKRVGIIVEEGKACPFGVCCKFGMLGKCVGVHSASDEQHFEGKRAGKDREKRAPCAYCVAGQCKWARRCGGCWRGMGGGDSDYSEDSDGGGG